MAGTRGYLLGLGAASGAAGLVAVAADAPVLGLVAGALGLVAAVLAVRSEPAVPPVDLAHVEIARDAAIARIGELEAAVAVAEQRAAEAEELVAAGDDGAQDLSAAEAEALVDPVTGLYGETFFEVTLHSRVAAARRHLRPVAIVLVEVAAGVREGQRAIADPAVVSGHVKATLREADTACHLEGNRFGLVLEDTPENGAVWTVERVRRALAAERKDLTLWAGVACYPAHAFDAGELLTRATAALDAAKEWRQDRIEVATTSDV
jgi:two-component system cell cycle response regulator